MSSVRWWVMNVFISRWTLLFQVWFVSSIRARSPDTSVLGLDLGVSKRRNVQRKYIVHFPLFIFFGIPLRNAYSRKITILYIRKHFGNKSFKLEPSVIDWEDFFFQNCENVKSMPLYWSRLSLLFVGRLYLYWRHKNVKPVCDFLFIAQWSSLSEAWRRSEGNLSQWVNLSVTSRVLFVVYSVQCSLWSHVLPVQCVQWQQYGCTAQCTHHRLLHPSEPAQSRDQSSAPSSVRV